MMDVQGLKMFIHLMNGLIEGKLSKSIKLDIFHRSVFSSKTK